MRARRHDSRRAGRVLAVAALIGGVLLPWGSTGAATANAAGSTTQTEQTATSDAACPAFIPPNELLLAAGTPQTAQLDATFANALQVTLANTNGCPVSPVAGTPVTFNAPAGGASASLAASGAGTLTVGADSSGNASAGTLTANDTPGSYGVTAQSAYGSVSFSLTNTAAGIPATVTALPPIRQQAIAGSQYPLAARVLDATGQPVTGVTVTFTLRGVGSGGVGGSSNGSRDGGDDGRKLVPVPLAVTVTDAYGNPVPDTAVRFAAPAAGASGSFNGRRTSTIRTNKHGIAVAPSLIANRAPGGYIVTATTGQAPAAAFALVNQAP